MHPEHHHWNPFALAGARGRAGGHGPGGRGPGGHGRGGHGHGHDGGGGHRGGPFDALGFINLLRRGPRARRGDVRSGILALLAEQPRNGYQIMQELEQRSRGMWRPSPGAVYPALQQLEDEGLVTVEASGGGRLYSLTTRGRAEATSRAAESGTPWEAVSDAAGDDIPEMFRLLKQVSAAALQVVQAGSPKQIGEARRLISETRRALYRLLAEDAGDVDAGDAPDDKARR